MKNKEVDGRHKTNTIIVGLGRRNKHKLNSPKELKRQKEIQERHETRLAEAETTSWRCQSPVTKYELCTEIRQDEDRNSRACGFYQNTNKMVAAMKGLQSRSSKQCLNF